MTEPTVVTTEPTDPNAEPKLYAGKYKTTEEMETGYKALEAKLGAKPAEEPKAEPAKEPEANPAAPMSDSDWATMATEVAGDGKLSEESLAKVKAMGIPDSMVESYVENHAQKVAAQKSTLSGAVGGSDAFDKITQWGAMSLSEADQTFIQGEVDKGGEAATSAMEVLKGRYESANGKMPKLLGGSNKGQTDIGSGGFDSASDFKLAFADPRYKTDAGYRAKVEARVAASSNL